MGGRGTTFNTSGKTGAGEVTASEKNVSWFNNVGRRSYTDALKSASQARSDSERRYFSSQADTWRTRISTEMGVPTQKVEDLVRGRTRLVAQKDEPAPIRATPQAARKTFVNGFGEATTRHVTSPTYERAKKRAEKAVKKNMGFDRRLDRK